MVWMSRDALLVTFCGHCVHVCSVVQARDPIPQLKKYMLGEGLATEDDIKAIHDR